MIILTERQELLKDKEIIKSELNKIQKAFYDEDILIEYRENSEENLYLEVFDFINSDIINCETYNKVIGLKHDDIKSFPKFLSNKLINLFDSMNIKKLILISHLKLDFFGNRENEFQPLVSSYKFLEDIVKQKTYKEAFIFDLEDLPNFIEFLFWSSRCDPSTPEYIFIFDEAENLQMNLCKYGNIHLTEFNIENLSLQFLKSLDWNIIDGNEFDQFSKNATIEGRELNLNF